MSLVDGFLTVVVVLVWSVMKASLVLGLLGCAAMAVGDCFYERRRR